MATPSMIHRGDDTHATFAHTYKVMCAFAHIKTSTTSQQARENVDAEFVNLCDHPINLMRADGTEIVVQPSGTFARAKEVYTSAGYSINGVEVIDMEYGDVENVPEPRDNAVYIVSSIVRDRLQVL